MSTVKIRTSHNVIVEHNLATAGDRLLGAMIDKFLFFVYFFGLILTFFSGELPTEQKVTLLLIFLTPVFFYSLGCEYFFNGQSVGKKIMQTRVVRIDGSQPTIGNLLIRWVLRLVDVWILSGAIGFVFIAATPYGQRLGDMAAGTVVIKVKRKTYLSNTLPVFSENKYIPVFPQVAQLNDSQAAIIKEALDAYMLQDNYTVVDTLSIKLKELLQLDTNMPPLELLQTILKDYSNIHNS